MYTTTVELVNADNSQDEDGTSECNTVLRAESQKIFEQYNPRVEHKGDKPRKRLRSRSRTRYHSQSRGRENINKSQNQRKVYEGSNDRYRSKLWDY